MTRIALPLLLVSLVAVAAMPARVFYIEGIPRCWGSPRGDGKHNWVNRDERPPHPIKGIPAEDCQASDVYETCPQCFMHVITMIYYRGPRCPKAPPPGSCGP